MQKLLNEVNLSAWEIISEIWNFILIDIQGQAVRMSNLVTALILFMVGVAFSKRLSHWFEARFLRSFDLKDGKSEVIQTLFFYLLAVFFGLLALTTANIPITIFTFFGGALALGVGFGSQNLLNNFISGLIVLFERPVKVGDFIDIDGTQGTIQRIGGRSTTLIQMDNTHVIVPNSWLLEKRLHNWNYVDRRIRTHVSVGIAYGSDTQKFKAVLVEACGHIERIAATPAPLVVFHDFGDNALLFSVYFWVEVPNQFQRYGVESDLRFEIDRLCRAAAITIAFPQRDVHLDTLKPLEIRLHSDSGVAEAQAHQKDHSKPNKS